MDFRTKKENEYRENNNIRKVKASGIIFDYDMERDSAGNVIKVTAIGSVPNIDFQQANFYPLAKVAMDGINAFDNYKIAELPHVIKGTAVLKENDVNDVKTAKEIARLKALRQYYKFYSNFVKYYLDEIAVRVEKGYLFWEDIEKKLSQYNDRIASLVKGENND